MMRLFGLLVLAIALTFGMAQSDRNQGDPPEAPATSEEGGAAEGEDAGEAAEGEPADAARGGGAGEPAAEEFDFDDPEAAFEQLMAQERDPVVQPNEVAEFLAGREDMSIFLMLLDQAGMTETLLEGDRPITIFAPSDSAFAEIDRLRFSTMVDDPETLRAVLERHIAVDSFSITELDERLRRDETVAGGGEAAPAAEAPARAADGDAAAEADADAVTEAAEEARLDPNAFFRITTRAGEDIEFGRLPASERAAALAGDEAEVAGGGAAAEAAAEDAEAAAAADAAQETEPAPIPGIFYVGDAQIVEPDLTADDTRIHVIDAVLLPPMPEEPVEA
jgi:uncharacterized surface protein with fasciclin (FAS1) repeats